MNREKFTQLIFKLLSILRPKFYNRLTWVIVISGLALISSSLFEKLLKVFFELKYDISLTDGSDSFIGLALVVVALIYHSVVRWFDWRTEADKIREGLGKDIRHDVEVFHRTNQLLEESDYKQILDWIATQHAYHSEMIKKIDGFIFEAEKDGNSFLTAELEAARQQLLNDVVKVRRFLS